MNKDGSLTTKADYRALSDDLPEMMRFGMIMILPESYDNFTWYGRGPWENYVDRNQDTFMGIWNGLVKDQAFPYYRPQETGNKTDVRWLTLTNKDGKGIQIEGCQPLSVSATNNKPEDLDAGETKTTTFIRHLTSKRNCTLCRSIPKRSRRFTILGASPLDQFRFSDKEYTYSYTISVIE